MTLEIINNDEFTPEVIEAVYIGLDDDGEYREKETGLLIDESHFLYFTLEGVSITEFNRTPAGEIEIGLYSKRVLGISFKNVPDHDKRIDLSLLANMTVIEFMQYLITLGDVRE